MDRRHDKAPARAVCLSLGARVTIHPAHAGAPDAAAITDLQWALAKRFMLSNPVYDDARTHGRSTRDLDPVLTYYEWLPDGRLLVPRGALEQVFQICRQHGLEPRWDDQTHTAPPLAFTERIPLSAAQEHAVQTMLTRRMGVLEAPAGSGKTIMALALVARRRQPALIIVHTKELAHQAVARAGMVLGLAPEEIGFVGDGQCRIGERLTVALVQTLAGDGGIPPALLQVGHVIVDECHHTPAAQTARVIAQLPARYLAGLSATPYRRDGLDAVIGFYLGPVVARLDKAALADRLIEPRIIKRETHIRPWGDSFTELVSALATDARRNDLICTDVIAAVNQGRRCLVLSDRTEHVEELAALLVEAGISAAALHGRLPKKERQRVVDDLNAGTLDAVAATGALIGEGFDCPRLDTLFLATPVSFEGRITQYLGRVSRTAPGKSDAVVYDYVDAHPMLWSSWGKRGRLYRRRAA